MFYLIIIHVTTEIKHIYRPGFVPVALNAKKLLKYFISPAF